MSETFDIDRVVYELDCVLCAHGAQVTKNGLEGSVRAYEFAGGRVVANIIPQVDGNIVVAVRIDDDDALFYVNKMVDTSCRMGMKVVADIVAAINQMVIGGDCA